MSADTNREKIIIQFLHDIEEFCDGAQLIVSGTDPDGKTWSIEEGIGNMHARIKAAECWLETLTPDDSGGTVLHIDMSDEPEDE